MLRERIPELTLAAALLFGGCAEPVQDQDVIEAITDDQIRLPIYDKDFGPLIGEPCQTTHDNHYQGVTESSLDGESLLYLVTVDGRCGPNPDSPTGVYSESNRASEKMFELESGRLLVAMFIEEGEVITNTEGWYSKWWILVGEPEVNSEGNLTGVITGLGYISNTWVSFTVEELADSGVPTSLTESTD